MATWIDIGSISDFPAGAQVCTTAADKAIVVMNVEGKLFVCSNVCPHAGLPIGDGERRGHVLTCPYHGYAYNIKTGRNIDFPDIEPPVPTFNIRTTDDGRVEVEIVDEDVA